MRRRPAYPDSLIDRACEVAGLTPGARVWRSARHWPVDAQFAQTGFAVTAVEPGEQPIARTRDELAGAGEVEFVGARLEEASAPRAHYWAVFSATAIHWVDPDVSWRRSPTRSSTAERSHWSPTSVGGPAQYDDQQALRATLARIAPELAAEWPKFRDLDDTLAGAEQRRRTCRRRGHGSGSYESARGYVSGLFEDAQLAGCRSSSSTRRMR